MHIYIYIYIYYTICIAVLAWGVGGGGAFTITPSTVPVFLSYPTYPATPGSSWVGAGCGFSGTDGQNTVMHMWLKEWRKGGRDVMIWYDEVNGWMDGLM